MFSLIIVLVFAHLVDACDICDATPCLYMGATHSCASRSAWLMGTNSNQYTAEQAQQAVAQECRATCGSCVDNRVTVPVTSTDCEQTIAIDQLTVGKRYVVMYSLYSVDVLNRLSSGSTGAIDVSVQGTQYTHRWSETISIQQDGTQYDHDGQRYEQRFQAQETSYNLVFENSSGSCTKLEHVYVIEDKFDTITDSTDPSFGNIRVLGCTDKGAFNYDSTANTDDGSCVAVVEGCMDSTAFNYDSTANTDNGSCVAIVQGCTDATASNYNPAANTDDGLCVAVIPGYTSSLDVNFIANTSYRQKTMNQDHSNCKDYQTVLQECVDECNRRGCVAFFYQEHPNSLGCNGRGYQICAFYTDNESCNASNYVRHGHRDGSLIMIKDTCTRRLDSIFV